MERYALLRAAPPLSDPAVRGSDARLRLLADKQSAGRRGAFDGILIYIYIYIKVNRTGMISHPISFGIQFPSVFQRVVDFILVEFFLDVSKDYWEGKKLVKGGF